MGKACSACGEVKDPASFGKYSGSKDGLKGQCRQCRAIYTKKYTSRPEKQAMIAEWRKANAETIRIKSIKYRSNPIVKQRMKKTTRDWNQKDTSKEAHREQSKIQRERWPEKARARNIVNSAIAKGLISRNPCQICGATDKIEAHHEDYLAPLDITWLCFYHHRELHTTRNIQSCDRSSNRKIKEAK